MYCLWSKMVKLVKCDSGKLNGRDGGEIGVPNHTSTVVNPSCERVACNIGALTSHHAPGLSNLSLVLGDNLNQARTNES